MRRRRRRRTTSRPRSQRRPHIVLSSFLLKSSSCHHSIPTTKYTQSTRKVHANNHFLLFAFENVYFHWCAHSALLQSHLRVLRLSLNESRNMTSSQLVYKTPPELSIQQIRTLVQCSHSILSPLGHSISIPTYPCSRPYRRTSFNHLRRRTSYSINTLNKNYKIVPAKRNNPCIQLQYNSLALIDYLRASLRRLFVFVYLFSGFVNRQTAMQCNSFFSVISSMLVYITLITSIAFINDVCD